MISEPIRHEEIEKINDEIKFVYNLQINKVGEDIFVIPIDKQDESFVIKLDEDSHKVMKYIIDTKSINKTLDLLYKDFPNENKEEIKENLFDFIYRFKAQNIIY